MIGKDAQAAKMAPALRGFSRRFKLRTWWRFTRNGPRCTNIIRKVASTVPNITMLIQRGGGKGRKRTRMKVNSFFQCSRVSRGTESKSRLNFPQSVVIWFAMSSASVGPLGFIKSKVKAAIYQDILDYFMLPSAADFLFPG